MLFRSFPEPVLFEDEIQFSGEPISYLVQSPDDALRGDINVGALAAPFFLNAIDPVVRIHS